MKLRTFFLTAAACVMLSAMSAMTALAAGISTVRIDLAPEEESSMTAGDMSSGEEPATYDHLYFVYDYSTSGDRTKPGKSYTYTIEVHPMTGNSFTETCAVEVLGATKVEMLSRNENAIRLRCTTYPFYVLKNPTGFEHNGDEISWDKVTYATKYNVYIYWTDADGDYHESKTSVTGPKHAVNVSSYSSGGRSVDHISVQAAASGDGGGFIAKSMFICDDATVDGDKTESDYSFSIPTARSNAIVTSNSTVKVKNNAEKIFGPGFNLQQGSPASTLNPTGVTGTGSGQWMQYMNKWYYIAGNQFLTGWICPDGLNWYLMGSDGAMLTGLQRVDGRWYLLNTTEGATYGAMLHGWWKINDKFYYFNQLHDGTFGAMLTNTTTPDGLHVGADGAWLGY